VTIIGESILDKSEIDMYSLVCSGYEWKWDNACMYLADLPTHIEPYIALHHVVMNKLLPNIGATCMWSHM